MALVRWDPFREFGRFEDRWRHLFQDFSPRRTGDTWLSSGAWIPPVDIYEDGKNGLVIKAELPGMKRDEVTVTVENDTLSISGERKFEHEVREDQVYRLERSYGTFHRSFVLPKRVESGKVRADYADGTLSVTLPLREDAKPKQIPVGTAA